MITVIIPMAGNGKRLADAGYIEPKPLVKVDGKTLAEHSITTLGIEDALFLFVTKPFSDTKYNEDLKNIFDRLNIDYGVAHIESGDHLGAAHSSLYLKNLIIAKGLEDSPLIITNCDQILKWDANKFLKFVKAKNADGAVVLYKSTNPKNSFARIEDGLIKEIIEKDPVSDDALIGVHYWKKASDFITSAKKLVAANGPARESYVSETYNFLINSGKKIYPYWLGEDEEFIPIGTHEDIERYLGRAD